MKSMTKRMHWPSVAVLAVAALWIGHVTQANRPAPPEPARIATINIEDVFNALNERSAADAELLELSNELEAERVQLREEIELLKEDLQNVLQPGTPAYEESQEALVWKTAQLRAFVDFAQRKLDREQSKLLRRIYENMKRVIGELSDDEGYDVVFVDDSVVELPADVTEAEMMRQISARRMLFSSPVIDISEALIERMNAEFSARQQSSSNTP